MLFENIITQIEMKNQEKLLKKRVLSSSTPLILKPSGWMYLAHIQCSEQRTLGPKTGSTDSIAQSSENDLPLLTGDDAVHASPCTASQFGWV